MLLSLLGGVLVQVVDVGARGGADQRWLSFKKLVEVVGFEPDPEEWRRLSSLNTAGTIRFLPYALGRESGRRPFYVCRQPGCSGLLPPNETFVSAFAPDIVSSMEVVKTAELEVVPFDHVAQKEGLQPDCLKVDVQGAELEVLQGAEQTLPTIKMVELEVEFNPQYVGQPLFADVDAYMRQRNFELLGLRRSFWRRRVAAEKGIGVAGGQIVHGDALYFNKGLLDAGDPDVSTLAKWLLLFCAYRQHDFALELLATHPAALTLTESFRTQLAEALAVQPRRLPRTVRTLLIPLLGDLDHHMLRKWVDDMRLEPAQDWHDPDFF